jgi:TonB family protein
MGYQALLFCPDEKTARTVTQVLNELEFNVEACLEPFAAVKKLMSQHFDAVVVDCDNEQNATLLFKSARNSTSNQASLAVAVVEGQAGVAKAFRIGANLVLTKPINLEQSKGTLRVARGLLRKGDPAKPAAAAPASAAAPAAPVPPGPVAAPAAPAKPVAAKPVAPVKPAAPATLSAATVARTAARPVAPLVVRPAAPPVVNPVANSVVKPVAKPAAPAVAAASSIPAAPKSAPVAPKPAPPVVRAPAAVAPAVQAPDQNLLEISADDSVATPSPAKPQFATPPLAKPSSAAASISLADEVMNAFHAAPAVAQSSGAASAPAPAREVPAAKVAEPVAQPVVEPAQAIAPAEGEAAFDQPAEAAQSESPSFVGAEPSFTFGGANLPEGGGKGKKTFLGIAAVVLVGAALYYGYTQYKTTVSQPAITQTPSRPAPVRQASPGTQPAAATAASAPANAASAPASSASGSQPNPAPAVVGVPVKTSAPAATDDGDSDSAPSSTKPSGSLSPAPGQTTAAAKPGPAALVVKGGKTPTLQAAAAAPDAPAPSMAGIATTGAGAPPPNLVTSAGSGPKPVLQTLNISQGVSQGLLIKQVQPAYPQVAMAMRVEGAVELLATISKTGDITSVKVLSGDTQLTRSAVDAVKQWKYRPYLLNGQPVEIQTQVTINFKLPH